MTRHARLVTPPARLVSGRAAGQGPGVPSPADRLVRGVGVVSLALAATGLAVPRRLADVAGVRDAAADASLPVLVRLVAARQGVLGLALLTRQPTDVTRSAGLFLPLTALDAVAVLGGLRSGVLRRRSAVMAAAVLATNVAVLARA